MSQIYFPVIKQIIPPSSLKIEGILFCSVDSITKAFYVWVEEIRAWGLLEEDVFGNTFVAPLTNGGYGDFTLDVEILGNNKVAIIDITKGIPSESELKKQYASILTPFIKEKIKNQEMKGGKT